MGLPWIRLDTTMADNPKVLGLLTERDGHRAAFVWTCCMAYSGKHGTAGFIAREAMPFVHGRAADMRLLVSHGFLKESAGGWDVNGWAEFQLTDEDMEKRREKGRQMAAARWSKKEARDAG